MDDKIYKLRRMESCTHKPPRSTDAPLGMVDSCRCGAKRFVLRYSGNTGDAATSGKRRWDRWS